jgi:uncharacterized membrane protein
MENKKSFQGFGCAVFVIFYISILMLVTSIFKAFELNTKEMFVFAVIPITTILSFIFYLLLEINEGQKNN